MYPRIDREKCINCGLCEKICPALTEPSGNEPIFCFAAWSKSGEIRKNAASGGIASSLYENHIKNSGVCFGARYIHGILQISEGNTDEAIRAFSGSKYIHAYVGTAFFRAKMLLEKGKNVVFVGTPCQIAGLRSYLRRDYENLLLVDLICHGVSPQGFLKEYINDISHIEYESALFRGIHVAYHRDASTWELHRSVNGIPAGTCGDFVKSYLSDIIDMSVDYETSCGTIRIPDPFHHCLILLLHTASHLTSEGVGLRHLCDWAVFANKVNVEQWKTELQNCGLYHFAQILTLTSTKYLGLPEQSWAGTADDTILEQLITDILDGGNFGKKDDDRYRQIKYISNRGEHTVDTKHPILQLWNTVNKKAAAEQKSRVGVVAEYIGLVVSGKRKLDTGKTIEAANQRKKLYAELHLYEPGENKE